MDPVKRAIILKEIERWRSSKLLPDHYCDFLRNLYIEQDDESDKQAGSWQGSLHLSLKGILFSLGLASLILLFLLYFTSFRPVMQTILSVVLVGILIAIGLIKKNKQPILSFAALGSSCLLTLVLGLMILVTFDMQGEVASVLLIVVCSCIWLAIGFAARIGVLQLCGYFALSLVVVWFIQYMHPNPSWWVLQAYMLPITGLIYTIGNYLYRGITSPGAMLMVGSGLFMIMPDVYGLLFTEISGLLLQLSLALKMALAGVAIWFQWKKNKAEETWMSE